MISANRLALTLWPALIAGACFSAPSSAGVAATAGCPNELNAAAKDLGAAASDIRLGSDASETTVKRAPLADYSIVYFATHGLVAADVRVSPNRRRG